MKIKLAQAFVMALCLYATTADALPWDKPTDAEIAALPPYCSARFRHVDMERWQKTMGSIFEHVHHYCGALVFLSRYYKISNPQDRRFVLGEVLSNIEYMIKHGDQRSALMPEIHLTKGRALILAGKHAEAANEFIRAIQLKPDYTAPYLAMADFYDQFEKKQDALKILQEGLRHIPTSRSLARRYQELGGKLPLPESPPSASEASRSEAQPSASVEAEKKVVEATPATSSKTLNSEQVSPSERPPEKTGSPSNPWCRFCTDDEPAPAKSNP